MVKAARLKGFRSCLRRAYRLGDTVFYSLPCRLSPAALLRRPGQTTVEYLMTLAVVAGMASIRGVMFHRRILGCLFTLVGMIIGAGTPTTGS